MSDDSLSQPVVLNRADGTRLEFRRCTPKDRMAFRANFKAYRLLAFKLWLDIEGVPLADRVPLFRKLDNDKVFESDALAWIDEPEGQCEAILLSLKHDKPGATLDDVYALNLDRHERLEVGAGVLDIPLVPVKGKEASGPFDDGTTTGPETPASSVDSPDTPTPSPSPSTPSDAT